MTRRLKALSLCLFLLLAPIATLAVEGEKSDSLYTPSIGESTGKPRRNLFVKAYDLLVGYLDSYTFDTAYIEPSRFYYTLMLQQSANFEHYTISGLGEKPQRLSFVPDHTYRIGAYFGWHGFFLGFSINADELFSDRNGNNKKKEYFINLYGQKLGADFFYRQSGNDFTIRSTRGFYRDGKKYDFNGIPFGGLTVKSKGVNVYYVFNNDHFSYPAAYAQTTVQRISRGTLVGGFSWSNHELGFDPTKLPVEIQNDLSEELRFRNVRYTDFNINFGYAFNWVFADNWLLAIALTPAVAYKVADIHIENSTYNQRYKNINFDFITRTGLVYNNNRFFVGANAVAHVYQYYQKKFALTDNFGVVNIYAGFNFGQRKKN